LRATLKDILALRQQQGEGVEGVSTISFISDIIVCNIIAVIIVSSSLRESQNDIPD
jgi:hypothetical protein